MCCGGRTTTSTGFVALAVLGSALTAISAAFLFETISKPNGELPVWYQADTCKDDALGLQVSASAIIYNAFQLRPSAAVTSAGITATTMLPDNACPLASSPPLEPVDIFMEAEDGYRRGGAYRPVILLSSGAYARISFSVLKGTGTSEPPTEVVLSQRTIELGADANFPWADADATSASSYAPPTPPPPPLATLDYDDSATALDYADDDAGSASQQGAPVDADGDCPEQYTEVCSEACAYASDEACDDGGPGHEYDSCPYGSDCADCGKRCQPASTGRRLLSVREPADEPAAGAWRREARGGRREARGGPQLVAGHTAAHTLPEAQDRYELTEDTFTYPGLEPAHAESERSVGPLVLRLHNLSLYSTGLSRAAPVFISFYTEDGLAARELVDMLMPLGWLVSLAAAMFIIARFSVLFPEDSGGDDTPRHASPTPSRTRGAQQKAFASVASMQPAPDPQQPAEQPRPYGQNMPVGAPIPRATPYRQSRGAGRGTVLRATAAVNTATV